MLCPLKRGRVQIQRGITLVRLRVIAFNVPTLGIVALTSMTLYVQIYTDNKRPYDPSTPSPLLAACVMVDRLYQV